MIVEFFGLPGCGKSTLIKSIISALPQKNTCIIEPSHLENKIHRISKLFELLYYLVNPKHYKIVKFVLQYPINKIRLGYTIYLMRLYKSLQKNIDKNKVIILDEGLLQSISSIPHDILMTNNLQLKGLLNDFRTITDDMFFIECNLPIEDDINRIRKRNRQDRFNLKEEDKLKKLLQIKKNNLKLLIDAIEKNKLSIDMNDPVEFNVDMILKKLKELP